MTRDEFAATYAFGLDDFQIQALDAIDAGRSVLVAAPTGSGKTVVAEYAVADALDREHVLGAAAPGVVLHRGAQLVEADQVCAAHVVPRTRIVLSHAPAATVVASSRHEGRRRHSCPPG